ncbi:hypothetical protein [Kitasatospora sp. NPDC096140]|uniref:hypothetical protein n=1 Tax=Kitasatospora sp. NPDC096140 TaxID=3155425 RepID=UPI00332CD73F
MDTGPRREGQGVRVAMLAPLEGGGIRCGRNRAPLLSFQERTGVKGKADGFDHSASASYSHSSVTAQIQLVGWQCIDSTCGPKEGTNAAVHACWRIVNQMLSCPIDGIIRSGGWYVSAEGNALANGIGLMFSHRVGNAGQKWAVRPDDRIHLPATITTDAHPQTAPGLLGQSQMPRRGPLGIWDCPSMYANQQWNLTYEERAARSLPWRATQRGLASTVSGARRTSRVPSYV